MTSSRISRPRRVRPEAGRAGTAIRGAALERANRAADRTLRLAGDARLGIALLLLTAAANAVAAALPGAGGILRSPAYLALLGALLLGGLASVAVRLPAAWREWRVPAAVGDRAGGVNRRTAELPPAKAADAALVLGRAGYRTRVVMGGERWTVHGTRHGYSRLAGVASHLALVVVVAGAALGGALATESTFSLMPGEQALLGPARHGFTDAVRLDRLDAAFGRDGRPIRLDTEVTFLREGRAVGTERLQVNRPGSFGGYLVHGWTYGPAARLRVETLDGRPLLHGTVAMDGSDGGRPSGATALPGTGVQLGMSLVEDGASRLAVTAAGAVGAVDTVLLAPGETARIGPLHVSLDGFDAYVTFLSRSDPGMGLVFGGSAALVALLAVALWLPRRRVTLRGEGGGTRLLLAVERFDDPDAELRRLLPRLGGPA